MDAHRKREGDLPPAVIPHRDMQEEEKSDLPAGDGTGLPRGRGGADSREGWYRDHHGRPDGRTVGCRAKSLRYSEIEGFTDLLRSAGEKGNGGDIRIDTIPGSEFTDTLLRK
jgi:hypothetical protein